MHRDACGRRPDIHVVFTTAQSTLAALETAGELARDLGAQIRLLATQIVPYPLPLGSPPAPVAFTERRFRSLASRATVRTRVEVYLCRVGRQTLLEFLKPRSFLVIGGRKRTTQIQQLLKEIR